MGIHSAVARLSERLAVREKEKQAADKALAERNHQIKLERLRERLDAEIMQRKERLRQQAMLLAVALVFVGVIVLAYLIDAQIILSR